jgi:hypothetical protein
MLEHFEGFTQKRFWDLPLRPHYPKMHTYSAAGLVCYSERRFIP